MVVIRFLFALLLGFVIGAGTTLWLVHSDAGDLVIRRTEVVQDLERRLREVEEQRDKLGRQTDDFARRFDQVRAVEPPAGAERVARAQYRHPHDALCQPLVRVRSGCGSAHGPRGASIARALPCLERHDDLDLRDSTNFDQRCPTRAVRAARAAFRRCRAHPRAAPAGVLQPDRGSVSPAR